jgi:hypothetical protein
LVSLFHITVNIFVLFMILPIARLQITSFWRPSPFQRERMRQYFLQVTRPVIKILSTGRRID